MKFIKYLAVIAIAVTYSCKSTYRNNNFQFKNNPFKVLDSLEQVRRKTNFTIKPVEDWKFRGESGSKYYSPDTQDKPWPRTFLSIYRNKVKESFKGTATLDDYLEYHVLTKKRRYPKEFKYKLIKAKHKLYGEIYVVNFIHRYNLKTQVENSLFILVDKNYGYTLEYKAKPEEFYKRLPEVEKMVNSFRITE